MSGIYLRDGAKLKSYGGTTKGDKSVVRVDVEFTDHYEAGLFLSSLQRLIEEQRAAAKPAKQLRLAHLSKGDA